MSRLSATASLAVDAALALVYPQPCVMCGSSVESRHDGVCCSRCWDQAPVFGRDETLCWKCGALSIAQGINHKRETVRCGRCDDYAFTAARACGPYEGAWRETILELKRQPHLPRRVTDMIFEVSQREPLHRAEVIIPVPLHASRERERGFNQAHVIARELARSSRLPLEEHSLTRQLHTSMHRAGMDAKARRHSVANAFRMRLADSIAGRRVLLVDDVLTTGATVSACAAVLRASGIQEVFVLTIARA